MLATALADATARRRALWAQVTAMVLNDLAWVGFWLIFFHRVSRVRGWDTQRVLLLYAVLTTATGIVLGLLSNSRRIPDLVSSGALDEALTLPVPTLPYLVIRKVNALNLGDLAFGVVLFLATGPPSPERIAVYLVGSLLGAVLLASFLVAAGSLVFFTGRDEPGGLGLQAILLLASYPVDIFTGTVKALLYTVIPAAFVAAVPAELIDRPSVPEALALAGAAGGFAAVAWLTFGLGLRQYASGSAWTRW